MSDKGPRVVGLLEAAAIAGVSKQRMAALMKRPDFPAPYQTLPRGRVWLAEDIERWNARRKQRAGPESPE